jgi:hypothetical protein
MKLEDERYLRPMRNEMEAMKYLRDIGPMITWENYPQSREWMINKNRINPALFPDPQQIAMQAQQQNVPPQAIFEVWKKNGLMTIDQKLKEEMQAERIKSAESLIGQRIESAEKISGERLSSAEKLAEARDKQLRELVEIRSKHAEDLAKLKADLKPEKDEATSDIKTFELTEYGKLVPEKRGTKEYKEARHAFDQGKSQAKKSTVMPEKAMDNMNGALDSMRLMDEIGSVADEALGVPGVGSIWMYAKSKVGSDKAQLFLNNLRQLKINAQTLIKGIPSNFDVQTFINSLPKEDDTPKEARRKVEIARKMLEDSLITGMQNYEKVYDIPDYMRQRYDASNIKGSLKPATPASTGSPNKIGRFTIEVE